jgi:hypothetical protein
MPDAQPLIYLVLGAAASGRREVLVDLIAGGLEAGDQPLVLLAESETATAAAARLPNLQRWCWREGAVQAPALGEATHVFLITDGRSNPIDQLEASKAWLETVGGELARIICVVHCQLAEKNPPLLAWYDACAHFADVLLLNRREGVENKWLSDFQNRYRDQFYPLHMELVKAGRVKNPALILETEARRMSHYFDAEPNWVITDTGADADEEELEDGEEEVEVSPEEDPYLAQWAGGRRVKELPDIRKYLPPAE